MIAISMCGKNQESSILRKEENKLEERWEVQVSTFDITISK